MKPGFDGGAVFSDLVLVYWAKLLDLYGKVNATEGRYESIHLDF